MEEDGPLRDGNRKAIEQKKKYNCKTGWSKGKKVYLCNSEREPTFGLPTSACYMVGMHVLTLLPSSSFFLHEFCPFAQSCFLWHCQNPSCIFFSFPFGVLAVISAAWNISRHISLKNGFHEFFLNFGHYTILVKHSPLCFAVHGIVSWYGHGQGRKGQTRAFFFRAIRRANEARVFVFIKRACLGFSRAYVIALQIFIIVKKKLPCQHWKGHTHCLWSSRGESFFLFAQKHRVR